MLLATTFGDHYHEPVNPRRNPPPHQPLWATACPSRLPGKGQSCQRRVGLGILLGLSVVLGSLQNESSAEAYPYAALRVADLVLSGPTDGSLGAIHFNPAAIRLASGSQIMAVGGLDGFLGSYQRRDLLPAGFAPGQQQAQVAEPTRISWMNPKGLVAASWDLRTDSVTLAFGLYTPQMDFTDYSGSGIGARADLASPTLQTLTTRYHVVKSETYSLWGNLSVGLRLRPWVYLGGGFNFAYTRQRSLFFRDLDPRVADDYSCAPGQGGAACEQWNDRMSVETDVGGWGYGFTAGALFVPLENRLWLGLSYVSPLFTNRGAEVQLDGIPTQQPWLPGDPCGGFATGARLTRRDAPPVCGTARAVMAFPHLVYLSGRGRIALSSSSRFSPTAIEITSWARVNVPPRTSPVSTVDLYLERRVFPQSLLPLPLSQRPALAITWGLRQIWPRLTLGQELLYESPRAEDSAVSPANLEGHKLDVSLAARLRVHKRLSVLLSFGVTYVFFSEQAGERYNAGQAATCRDSLYDISASACAETQAGFAVPTAQGSYSLVIPHGVTGLEFNL